MLMQFILGLMAGSGLVMGFLGMVYGVGMGHTMAQITTFLAGCVMVLAWFFRRRGIE